MRTAKYKLGNIVITVVYDKNGNVTKRSVNGVEIPKNDNAQWGKFAVSSDGKVIVSDDPHMI